MAAIAFDDLAWLCARPATLATNFGLLPYVLQIYPFVGKSPGLIGAGLNLIANLM
ncbi:hypothetical protein [Undibacterium sp. TJN19]|uniref:hypothetical protein n=1 Tax=Undibacterium sp. TJN19 TaxID=3413055 RepID=UPI003BF56346